MSAYHSYLHEVESFLLLPDIIFISQLYRPPPYCARNSVRSLKL